MNHRNRRGNQTCKLIAIVDMPDWMRRWLRVGKFLPPTLVGDTVAVGFKVGRRTWLAEGPSGPSFLAAYHELQKQVVG